MPKHANSFHAVRAVTFPEGQSGAALQFHLHAKIFTFDPGQHHETLKPKDDRSIQFIHRLWRGEGEDLFRHLFVLRGLKSVEVFENSFELKFQNAEVARDNLMAIISILRESFPNAE